MANLSSELHGMHPRVPTEKERKIGEKHIKQWHKEHRSCRQKNAVWSLFIGIFIISVTILMMFVVMPTSVIVFHALIGPIIAVTGFYPLKDELGKQNEDVKIFKSGNFLVIDGEIREVYHNGKGKLTGVYFESDNGKKMSVEIPTVDKNIQSGESAVLFFVEAEKRKCFGEYCAVFHKTA